MRLTTILFMIVCTILPIQYSYADEPSTKEGCLQMAKILEDANFAGRPVPQVLVSIFEKVAPESVVELKSANSVGQRGAAKGVLTGLVNSNCAGRNDLPPATQKIFRDFIKKFETYYKNEEKQLWTDRMGNRHICFSNLDFIRHIANDELNPGCLYMLDNAEVMSIAQSTPNGVLVNYKVMDKNQELSGKIFLYPENITSQDKGSPIYGIFEYRGSMNYQTPSGQKSAPSFQKYDNQLFMDIGLFLEPSDT